ncbi:MAG: trigger factor [Prevotella sp.]|nr:trigger factor [Prevotella sp.]MCI7496634.1 trigger factor [Prevotella sp.]MDD6510926.1 trigger factor [Prevotella sp.]MDD6536420.1 trigger factor [Prevotella sp.]MDD6993920.1 trigger factor [Prevotella sp.]
MNITFENPDKVSGVLTFVIEEADYQEDVNAQLKKYRKQANIPGFRPGQAPMGMIKRQVGAQVKVDVINKLVGEKLYDYVKENKINMLGEPMPHLGEEPVDLDAPAPYTLKFDIAVAPEFKAELSKDDKIAYYNIAVDDKLVDQQIEAFASRAGSYQKVDEYQDNDMLKGDLRELNEDGSTKEGGITVSEASMLPSYITVEEQKALFNGAKVGDIITFNPKKAYPTSNVEISSLLKISKEEAENVTADFSFQVTEISRYTKHAIDKELFDMVYGDGNVKDEADFRAKVVAGIQDQMNQNADFRLLQDVRTYVESKIGEVKYADELMKRIMLANNKDKGAEYVDKNYEASIKELTWSLAKNQIVEALGIKIEDADVKAAAIDMTRMQFAQYGMNSVPEEYLTQYAEEMLKKPEQVDTFINIAVDRKLMVALKDVVTLETKEISFEDFQKLAQ